MKKENGEADKIIIREFKPKQNNLNLAGVGASTLSFNRKFNMSPTFLSQPSSYESGFSSRTTANSYRIGSSPRLTGSSKILMGSGTTTTPIDTTATASVMPCFGNLTLYTKTYSRGENIDIQDTSLNIKDFNNKAVSATVVGSCCWLVYAETNLSGDLLRLMPGQDYSSVTSLGQLFRKVKSVRRISC